MAALLICHYLADFCLTFPAMIRAKADGRSPWPIMLHACIHAILIGICLLLWGVSWKLLLILILLELHGSLFDSDRYEEETILDALWVRPIASSARDRDDLVLLCKII